MIVCKKWRNNPNEKSIRQRQQKYIGVNQQSNSFQVSVDKSSWYNNFFDSILFTNRKDGPHLIMIESIVILIMHTYILFVIFTPTLSFP